MGSNSLLFHNLDFIILDMMHFVLAVYPFWYLALWWIKIDQRSEKSTTSDNC